MNISREAYLTEISGSWEMFSIVALLGPRQVGKTTIAMDYAHRVYQDNVPASHMSNPA